ncbi:MAG: RagB/SusD family nutrient uptake outer membrane protein [Prevotellaceae bacterium]|nr:RagB/SusD family nutrient uptake outer membrane protein [Prevotellaceae bacterium]
MKKYIFAIGLAATLGLSSCSDFLDETNRNAVTADVLYGTPDGYESLVNACYAYTKTFLGSTDGYSLTEMGTDCFTGAGSSSGNVPALAYYGVELNPTLNSFRYMWNTLYSGLNCTNAAIARIDDAGLDQATRNHRLGEVHFLRALYLHLITEIWGDAILYTDEIQGPETTATRTSQSEIYQQIFADLDEAAALLGGTSAKENGRVTLNAVKALKARLSLYREDWQTAASLAKELINSGQYGFYDTFAETFDMANEAGQNNKEAIWWVNFAGNADDQTLLAAFAQRPEDSPTLGGRVGNQSPIFACMSYWMVSGCGVWVTPDTHAPWVQSMPTLAYLHTFDENIDQRYDATFKGVWLVNSTTDNYDAAFGPRYGAPGPLEIGDTAFIVSKYVYTEEERAQHHYLIYDANDVFDPVTHKSFGTRDYFISGYKFHDYTLPTGWEYFSGRDWFVLRLAEMYLIASEAEMRLGNQAEAVRLMNVLREKRAIPGHEAEMRITDADLNIDFILDERGRELSMELQRFFDLKRTGKFVERIQKMNPDAADVIQPYHQLRPIPQSEIDALTNKEDFPQNPGY